MNLLSHHTRAKPSALEDLTLICKLFGIQGKRYHDHTSVSGGSTPTRFNRVFSSTLIHAAFRCIRFKRF